MRMLNEARLMDSKAWGKWDEADFYSNGGLTEAEKLWDEVDLINYVVKNMAIPWSDL